MIQKLFDHLCSYTPPMVKEQLKHLKGIHLLGAVSVAVILYATKYILKHSNRRFVLVEMSWGGAGLTVGGGSGWDGAWEGGRLGWRHDVIVMFVPMSLTSHVSDFTGSPLFHIRQRLAKIHCERDERVRRVVRKTAEHLRSDLAARKEAGSDVGAFAKAIVELPFGELRKKLRDAVYSAPTVVAAFQYHILTAIQPKINAVTVPIEDALEIALRLEADGDASRYSKPFWGVPFSLKDNFDFAGYSNSTGLLALYDEVPTKHNAVVAQFMSLGAIPIVRSNIPQTLMSYDCHNFLYGQTLNPHHLDQKLSPGGSSGGEAALLAAGGVHIGIGSDIGGSIRIPSAFCGTVGFKPTAARLSGRGKCSFNLGQTLIPTAAGPMTRDADVVLEFMNEMCAKGVSEKFDPLMPPFRWDEGELRSRRKLTIGYFLNDGWCAATPANQRAVLLAVNMLKQLGHKVVEFRPGDGSHVCHNIRGIAADGGVEYIKYTSEDIGVSPSVTNLVRLLSLPVWLRRLLYYPLLFLHNNLAKVVRATLQAQSCYDYWTSHKLQKEFRYAVAEAMDREGIDALLSPSFACPALPVGVPTYTIHNASYMSIYNVLDYPAGTLPITDVTEEDVVKMNAEYPLVDRDHKMTKAGLQKSVGLPVNVQIAAPQWKDERVLRLMCEMQAAADYTPRKFDF